MKLLLLISSVGVASAFVDRAFPFSSRQQKIMMSSEVENAPSSSASDVIEINPKEAVKVFGRLAEKYIMLDSSAGMCCYSACTDCEYRLPEGGYRMADQSAARPKWIPSYDLRAANGKEHISKWNSELFTEDGSATLNKQEFVSRLTEMAYAPPLGGPFVGKTAAELQDTLVAERFFDALADGKEKITKNRMSVRIKQLSGGEEGMTWKSFQSSLNLQ